MICIPAIENAPTHEKAIAPRGDPSTTRPVRGPDGLRTVAVVIGSPASLAVRRRCQSGVRLPGRRRGSAHRTPRLRRQAGSGWPRCRGTPPGPLRSRGPRTSLTRSTPPRSTTPRRRSMPIPERRRGRGCLPGRGGPPASRPRPCANPSTLHVRFVQKASRTRSRRTRWSRAPDAEPARSSGQSTYATPMWKGPAWGGASMRSKRWYRSANGVASKREKPARRVRLSTGSGSNRNSG